MSRTYTFLHIVACAACTARARLPVYHRGTAALPPGCVAFEVSICTADLPDGTVLVAPACADLPAALAAMRPALTRAGLLPAGAPS